MKTSSLTNCHPSFYPLLGPWLSRRDIVKALGHPVWDDPEKRWFVAQHDVAVVGMAALTQTGKQWVFGSFWVEPEHRRKGVGALLLGHAVAASTGERDVVATATADSVGLFCAVGFMVEGWRGRYTLMRLKR